MKTNELSERALDWAVSQCMTGGELFQSGRVAHAVILHSVGGTLAPYFVKNSGVVLCVFEPSTDWVQGGPIIAREIHAFDHMQSDRVTAIIKRKDMNNGGFTHGYGPTPLIAAMRCYVASKMGDNVDIPEGIE
jgi:hypothetical protein